jgi:thioredoxin reductase
MQLKSDGFATNLAVPAPDSSLAAYCQRQSIPYDDENIRVHLSTFVDYGLEFQSRYVPDLDQRDVVSITRPDGTFRIELEDHTQVEAQHVILAVGVTHFGRIPDVLSGLPAAHVTHSSAHRDLSPFAGKDVTVVGAGSSAVELAAQLDAAGAKPRLLVRGGEVKFNDVPSLEKRSLWQRIRHPTSGLGPGMTSWLCCTFPQIVRLFPRAFRMNLVRNHLGPKSLYHLRERVENRVPTLLRHELVKCTVKGNALELECRDQAGKASTIRTNHVIAATGYAARVDRLQFLAPNMRAEIKTYEGYPILSANFESSVPGLYFVGLASAGTFGPLMRFVYGAGYTAKRIATHFG